MKIAGFAVIGFVAVMAIAVGFVYFGETESMTPQISDDVVSTESVQINPSPNSDTIEVIDSVNIEINDGSYWIDDEGKKHYTIHARDVAEVED